MSNIVLDLKGYDAFGCTYLLDDRLLGLNIVINNVKAEDIEDIRRQLNHELDMQALTLKLKDAQRKTPKDEALDAEDIDRQLGRLFTQERRP